MKVVLNKAYGGFGLSDRACEELGCKPYDFTDLSIDVRSDERLVNVVEKLGAESNNRFSKLSIVEVPDDITDSKFFEVDGFESIWYVLDGKMHEA